ncbi:MAG: D-aminoacyl-tRNA deacylase [Candidatus Methylacidiphilales bacterium]
MRALLQRVRKADLQVNGEHVASIRRGWVVFLGITHSDQNADATWLAEKILKLKVFESEQNPPSPASVQEIGGEVMVVSQFTLHASFKKGTKPSYHRAAPPGIAEPLYQELLNVLREYGARLSCGTFGAHMNVILDNDGPITLMLDSHARD